MSSPHKKDPAPVWDLSRFQAVPTGLVAAGAVLAGIGAAVNFNHFTHAWLAAFMFFLSLCLGSLFLVLIHHLFDAGWSVPIRRFLEHIACLMPVMALLFLPIALLATKIYPWMSLDPHQDHALHVKHILFNQPMFYVVSAVLFGVWTWLTHRLRYWSLKQDETGAAECTHKLRRLTAGGVILFAFTLTLGAIFWMKALEHQWFSTMYGVYYFAGSVWMTVATTYLLAVTLKRSGPLREVVGPTQFYYLGTLLLAFTVFYAYIHFSQYFLIWNAAMPEETFWYVKREQGSWWYVGLVIIFGHFFLPFLALLRIDVKLTLPLMAPICIWAWAMHYLDLTFNIMPLIHPDGFPLAWLWIDLGCLAFMAGVLARFFIKSFNAHAPFPVKDPRLHEVFGISDTSRLAAPDGELRAHH